MPLYRRGNRSQLQSERFYKIKEGSPSFIFCTFLLCLSYFVYLWYDSSMLPIRENIMDIKKILKENNFRFNHSLGQNFITDTELLQKIVEISGVGADDTVIEIGAGAGTLSRELAKKAKKLYAFELDKNLAPILKQTLDFDNAEVIFKDILKLSDDEIKTIVGGKFKVVANLPYYVTTPMIMRFLESALNVESITVMVQQEVAMRLAANPDTSDYGVITVAVALRGEASIPLKVDKKYFYPIPKVDSAVVKIDVDRSKYPDTDKTALMKLVKSGFMMRRKVLTNNLKASYGISREQGEKLLSDIGLNSNVRGESLSVEKYIELLQELNKII